MGKKVLLTGASGFIGSALFNFLAGRGWDVIGLAGRGGSMHRVCDLRDTASIAEILVETDPDIVIHAAALSTVTGGLPVDYYAVNTISTENILRVIADYARRMRFIFLSTAGVYGNQDREVLDETLCPNPVHHYGISKLAAEFVTRRYADAVDFTIIRPFNIFGAGQTGDFIVPKLLDAFTRRQKVITLGNVAVSRDFLDIDTTCEIIEALLHKPASIGTTLNLCSGEATPLVSLIDMLRVMTGHDPIIEQSPALMRANEIWRLIGDPSAMDAVVGRESYRRRAKWDALKGALAPRLDAARNLRG